MPVTEADLAALRRDGYLVVPKLVGTDTTAAIRGVMDGLLGPWPRQICESAMFLNHDKQMEKSPDTIESALRDRRPVIMSGDYRHAMRHPLYAPVLGEVASSPAMLELQQQLLRPGDMSELKLMQQLLIRSDPHPSRSDPGAGDGAQGWHVRTAHQHPATPPPSQPTTLAPPDLTAPAAQQDMSFLPEHYTAVPRQCFYHTVTYLNTVDTGNAALMVVPGSAELSRSIVATLSEAELEQLRGPQYGAVLAQKVRPHIDTSQGVELLMEEGDTVVLDCMWCVSLPTLSAHSLCAGQLRTGADRGRMPAACTPPRHRPTSRAGPSSTRSTHVSPHAFW